MLISGYFLCTARFKLSKLVSLWLQVVFYSMGIYLLVCFFQGDMAFSVAGAIKNFFVICTRRYWYVTAYVLMYMLFPFLNCAIRSMSKRMHGLCCVVLLGIFSVASNLAYVVDFADIYGGYSFVWFCIMYIVAAYFRLYVPTRIKHQRWTLPVFILCTLGICGEQILAYWITPRIFGSVMLEGFFYSYNSILAVPCALSLFQWFRGLQIRSRPVCGVIRFFAPLTFAAYLIHGHVNFSSSLLALVDVTAYSQSFLLFPYLMLCTLAIVLVSCAIEWLRKWVFRVCIIDLFITKQCDRIQNRVVNWLEGEKKTSV